MLTAKQAAAPPCTVRVIRSAFGYFALVCRDKMVLHLTDHFPTAGEALAAGQAWAADAQPIKRWSYSEAEALGLGRVS